MRRALMAAFCLMSVGPLSAQTPAQAEISRTSQSREQLERTFKDQMEAEQASWLDRGSADVAAQALQGVLQRAMARLFVGSLQPVVKNRLVSDEAVPADGRLFVPLSLLVDMKDDDELTGMLAHAVAHSRLGPLRIQTGTIPVVFAPEFSPPVAIPVAYRKAVAEREVQADALAVEIMGSAGVGPAGLLRYLERAKAAAERLAALRTKVEAIGTIANTLPKTDECEIVQAWLNEQNAAQPRPTLRRANN